MRSILKSLASCHQQEFCSRRMQIKPKHCTQQVHGHWALLYHPYLFSLLSLGSMLHYFRFDLTNLNKTKFRPYFATLSAHGPHFSYDSVYRFTFLPNSSVIFVDRSCCIVRVPNHFMDAYKHDDSFNKVARHTKQIYVLKRLYTIKSSSGTLKVINRNFFADFMRTLSEASSAHTLT